VFLLKNLGGFVWIYSLFWKSNAWLKKTFLIKIELIAFQMKSVLAEKLVT
jgi:hypothetical protein